MEESFFGPWKREKPVNKWHEWKIGKIDSWYSVSANSLQSTINDQIKIESQNENIEKNGEIQAEKIQSKSISRFGDRGSWGEPRSYDAFLSSPQNPLKAWPKKAVSLEDSIAQAKTVKQPKNPQKSKFGFKRSK